MAIAVAGVSVGGRGAAVTSEATSVMIFEAIFAVTSDVTVVAKATADATALAGRATAVRAAEAISDVRATAPRTRQRRRATATPHAFRSRPAGPKSSRY